MLCVVAGHGPLDSSADPARSMATHTIVQGGPRGVVELSCPDDVAFRIGRALRLRVDLDDPGAGQNQFSAR